ncbi:MAG: DNA repair protein RecN [Bacteriovoracaceae bacterium]
MDSKFFLKKLLIQNFATFKNQTIEFRPGFNAIIGETGSGKSLVLDALQLILGGRADKKVVRRETEYSLIEASFFCHDPEIRSYLEHEGFPIEGHELIIKRLIYRNGTTKNYINHLATTVSFLAHFSRRYMDLVGQFENQKLLSETYQLHLLDQFGKHLDLVKKFQTELEEFKSLKQKQDELEQSKSMREQRLDYLSFQLQEIEKLNPSSQDEEDLLKKKSLMMNIEKTHKIGTQLNNIFDGEENQNGILTHLKLMNSLFSKNQDIFLNELQSIAEIEDKIFELQQSINKKLDFEFDPEELEGVLDRLDLYQKLKKKFGGSVESILQHQIDFLKEKTQLEELEINLGDLSSQIDEKEKSLHLIADELHKLRSKKAKTLGDELTQKVRELKMSGATIKVEIQKVEEFLETGMTKAFFIAETNPGEGYFKIKETASGGELSRILLGLRQVLSSYDSISIFLFDEIDTGIGGETATYIGKALSEVASQSQVIAITHLPQIAQYAQALMVVNKDVNQEDQEMRTESSVREVFGKMIMKEVRVMAQL